MKRIVLLLLILLVYRSVNAQEIENVDVSFAEGNIVLIFDLLPQHSIKEQYDLEITSSKDDFSTPLLIDEVFIKNINPKNRLHVTIDGLKNFEGYEGELGFNIKAILVYSPLRFLLPDSLSSIKKGKSIYLSWVGGTDGGEYDLEVFKAGKKVSAINSALNRKVTTWDIPKDFKAGAKYKIKVVSTNNQSQGAFTKEFSIKRKIPLMVKVLPLAILGGVIAVLVNDNSSDGLPPPPDPPD